MLVEGARILTRKNGVSIPVERLKAGDSIFNPVTRKPYEITCVMSRQIALPSATAKGAHPLRPIVFSAGSLDGDLPMSDVAVSPMQKVLANWRLASEHHMKLKTAKELARGCDRQCHLQTETTKYFAIFTHGKRFMNVTGLILQTYDARSYDL